MGTLDSMLISGTTELPFDLDTEMSCYEEEAQIVLGTSCYKSLVMPNIFPIVDACIHDAYNNKLFIGISLPSCL